MPKINTKLWHQLWKKQAPGLSFERFKELAMQGIFAKPGKLVANDHPPMNLSYVSTSEFDSDQMQDYQLPWGCKLTRRII